MTARRVGITGLGIVTGYGTGIEALWQGLSSGRSAVRGHRARMGRKEWLTFPMAALPADPATFAASLPNRPFVEENRIAEDPDLISIAESVRQALADSGVRYDPAANDLGLVVTHESPGLTPHVQSFFRWGETARAWLRSGSRFNLPEFLYERQHESVYRLHSFLYVHYLCGVFGLHGFSLYNNNACASGTFALALAADRIRSGGATAMVVAGGDVPEDGTKYRWFRDRGLYSASGSCRPFSVARDGLVLGSGAAALVVEDLERAEAEGRRVYAEWLGGGFTSDGWKVTVPDVAGMRYATAISRAVESAGIAAHDVTAICPHGVGAGLLDRFEAESLAAVFGSGDRAWPAFLPFKGALGHTLGGCALVETVSSLVALGRGEVPAVVRHAEIDPALPIGRPRSLERGSPWVFLKCTNGFAGQNGAVVLRSPR